MPEATIEQGAVFAGGVAVLLSRVVGLDGTPITQASLSSITLDVWPDGHPDVFTIDSEDIPVADVVFDTLQTNDPRWTGDDEGYNFAHQIAADAFPDPGKRYIVRYTLVDPDENPYILKFKLDAR